MTDSVQLLGISNAIVDVLAHVDEEFLQKIGAERGSMTLIDKEQARELYGQMGPATEMSGTANQLANIIPRVIKLAIPLKTQDHLKKQLTVCTGFLRSHFSFN